MNHTLSAIIWDWNGTLLDDVLVNLHILNHALKARGYNKISLTTYRENFTFPVKDFYQSLGFDFDREDFNRLSNEFINDYFKNMKKARLFDGVIEILTFFKQSRIPQYVLSAMEQKRLEQSLSGFNILHFFDKVKGLDNILANGKVEAGKKLITETGINTETTWIVGDTLHDLQVAQQLNLRCVLLSCGHQTAERLHGKHRFIVNDLNELKLFFVQRLNE